VAFWRYYAALIVLCAAETFFAHQDAFVMLVYIAVLSVASRYLKAIPIIAVVIAISIVAPHLIPSWRAAPVDYSIPISIGIVSLAMFGFFGLVRTNEALAEARTEVARLAAENERTRIARDLHDLLGHSLTTITIKAGLANRIAGRNPTRAATEIAEVESLARQALTDVRAAVSGYREVTLGNELAAAREVLRAAGISAELPGAIDSIAPAESELFAWVLREGVTNVVRHSRASKCEVRLSPKAIEITDNGVGSAAGCGNGLTGLRERVAAAGGTLSVQTKPAISGWRLRVEARS
jgi:two-component system sensor histidine kinase DesK